MTARERWRRAYGYARASAKDWAETVRLIRASGGFWCYCPERQPTLATLRQHESHAWRRLPDNARKAVMP